ncbi:hypothetical protein PPUN15366_15920 [Pseudomonas putida]|nr:hypothetical protein PPUN15366_15920 [Pseudomonas putida]
MNCPPTRAVEVSRQACGSEAWAWKVPMAPLAPGLRQELGLGCMQKAACIRGADGAGFGTDRVGREV